MDHLMNHPSNCIHITFRGLARYFWRLEEGSPSRFISCEIYACGTEIREDDVWILQIAGGGTADEDVFGLDVAVDDTGIIRKEALIETTVKIFQCGEELRKYFPDKRFRKMDLVVFVPVYEIMQVTAGTVFEMILYEIVVEMGLEGVFVAVHVDDVFVGLREQVLEDAGFDGLVLEEEGVADGFYDEEFGIGEAGGEGADAFGVGADGS